MTLQMRHFSFLEKKWKSESVSGPVMSDSLGPHGLKPARLLCPWEFSRQEYQSGLSCPPPGDLPNLGTEPRSCPFRAGSLLSGPAGKPKNTGVGSYPFSSRSFPRRNWTRVSCIAGEFFTSWANSEAHWMVWYLYFQFLKEPPYCFP